MCDEVIEQTKYKGKNRRREHWLQTYWRPLMAMQYFVICLFDFMLAPIGLSIYAIIRDVPYIVWHPLTIEGGGLYHLSLGAILGVSAWTRGQEKVADIREKT